MNVCRFQIGMSFVPEGDLLAQMRSRVPCVCIFVCIANVSIIYEIPVHLLIFVRLIFVL